MSLAPIAAVEYLEAAVPFTINHGLVMTIAETRFGEHDEPVVRFPGGPETL